MLSRVRFAPCRPQPLLRCSLQHAAARFCYVLAAFSENGARLPSCNTCIRLPRLAQVGAAYGGLSIQHRRSQIPRRPWPMAHLAEAQH